MCQKWKGIFEFETNIFSKQFFAVLRIPLVLLFTYCDWLVRL